MYIIYVCICLSPLYLYKLYVCLCVWLFYVCLCVSFSSDFCVIFYMFYGISICLVAAAVVVAIFLSIVLIKNIIVSSSLWPNRQQALYNPVYIGIVYMYLYSICVGVYVYVCVYYVSLVIVINSNNHSRNRNRSHT